MADSPKKVIEALHSAAEELRKQAAEIRGREPIVKQGGFYVDKRALKELIANEGK